MTDNYVLIKTYDNAFEADLAKGLLEQNGISAELRNEMINSIYPSFAGDMYRLELCVPNEQADLALSILEASTDGFFTYKILQESGALLEGHFQLTSGRHSNRYIEKIRILQNPEQASELCRLMANRLDNYEFDAVVGPAYGGIALAFETAKMLGKQFLFTQRKDQKMVLREGFDLSRIKTVAVIEDIVTTGNSIREVIESLKNTGIETIVICAVVDRSGGKLDLGSIFSPLLTLEMPSWEVAECQLCKADIPLTKPGSSNK